jgi:hypothetical protein
VKFREKTGDTNRGNINMYGGTFSLLTNLWWDKIDKNKEALMKYLNRWFESTRR